MARLIIESSRGLREAVELTGTHHIGRHPDQDIQIIDRLVSKQQCVVQRSAMGWEIVDAGSRNGTFVNNKRIEQALLLQDGDRIMLGATRLVFEADQTAQVDVDISGDGEAPMVQSVLDAHEAMEFQPAQSIVDDEQLRRDYEKLRFAYQLHRELALEFNLDVVLDRVLRMLFTFLPAADRAMILLTQRGQQSFYPAKKLYRQGIDEAQRIAVSSTILAQVAAEKRALLTNDAIVDSRFDGSKSIVLQGIRSAMAVPMLGHDQEVLGILHVDSLRRIGAFSERDLNIVYGFASQAALTIENSFFADKMKEEAANKEKLQRFLSPNLVQKVLAGELLIQKGGEERDVAILFSDIRQFTPMAGRHRAGVIVDLLNRYFERMAEVVFDYDGTLDKFIGDALMAIWGAPIASPNDAVNAVQAAIRMQLAMREFNIEAEELIGQPIGIGIGIDFGPVVAGLMGSSRTMNYTVIGSYVNRASRLCSNAGPGEVMVSDSMFRAISGKIACQPATSLHLKGFDQPQAAYKVLF